MKQDSEIGEALEAGHPCYFVGFLPKPVPGQTVEDVCRAEAHFIETVAARHKKSRGKPALIGNCQAGWQVMMACAMRPDLPGPILLAGSPLSYWAGIHGKAPMRYLGGLLGGTWLTVARRRSWRWPVRRRQPDRQFRVDASRQRALEKDLPRLRKHRHRTAPVPRIRKMVGKSGSDERRRNAVHRR